MNDPLLIGIDVGTTAVKAALFEATGRSLKMYISRYPTVRPAPGIVEQNAEDWVQRCLDAITTLTDCVALGRVSSIGLTSQVNTHVFVDDHGAALLPAFVWQDGRCAHEAAELDKRILDTDRLRWWGAPLPVDSSHVLARMAYVARHRPEIWARTCWVMAPKDYCIFRLTGEVRADPMTSFGVVDGTLAYIPELLALVPGAAERLPSLAPFTASAGRIRAGLPASGAPMVVGTMDAWAGLLGAGVARQDEAVYLSGTSEVLGIVSERKVPTPGVIAFARCEGIVLHAGPTQAGGASIEWLAGILNQSPAALSDLVGTLDLARPAPIFLPHLAGERAPLWDITSRASFSGMTSATSAADLSRAVFEGVAYSARLLLQSLEQSSNCHPESLNLAGGGARSDIWCQIRADVLGRPLRRTANRDAGVLGAAILAGVGNGLFANIDAATRQLVVFDRTFEPNPAQAGRHAFGFGKYLELYQQLKSFNADFVSVANPARDIETSGTT